MWNLSIRRLLLATLLFAVAFAAVRVPSREPYGIVLASLAIGYAALALFYDAKWLRTERAATLFLVSVMLGSLILLGASWSFWLSRRGRRIGKRPRFSASSWPPAAPLADQGDLS
ncbi:MAG: hypothetical protein DWQ37_07585 [Planctomycetota bacterium]|nr:MAG: hypothetical protein DWQ37_07585 [Planctomycetota bacterium]